MLPSLQIEGSRATITLRRPEMANKLTPEDLPELRRHFATVDATPAVLVLVLRSEGKHFCSGFDIGSVAQSQTEGSGFGDMVDALENCRAVTIAALQGGVYGGATDMVLACDFRLGCEAGEMFMPAARLGLHYYPTGMQRYVSRLGLNTAKRLFLTAEKIGAQAMLDCGFLTHLVPRESLPDEVERLAATLGAMAPIPLLGMKQHLNRIAQGRFDPAAAARDVARSVVSQDLAEGGQAWKEKRTPVFTGR
ncbi:enoyl-CoA hydratase/isomerase family protein [Xylophilus sp. Leaf220]|uniref:enoyl-CoA hydratase/isomerase family protein n=1 Tax=Xylophilus sp. Leaf220 TaxID=1735686 RepID=UPI00070194FD|nr:enoyl-CoA hydratase/isomerase family protein [Xylophilus sp. Leaf220]KQM75418.1 3-hydroxybutyryl-CoA dehydratase [Xylophilus sp. Leaf220]